MALEGKDINDSTIIDATKKYMNAQGHTQFKITLPSGRELESEWLSEDNVKKALHPWLDTVRAEMLGDADEKRAQARRAAAALPKPAPVLVSPSGDALTAETVPSAPASGLRSTRAVPAITSQPSVQATSPDSFAKQGLEQAEADAEYWYRQNQEARERWLAAVSDVEKWKRILNAIGGNVNDKQQVSSNRVGAVGADYSDSEDVIRAPRRGRKAGSRNKPRQPEGTGAGIIVGAG